MARELRIIGPPGCGKTTELARRAAQAAQRYGGENVVVCSLTRAAAAEVAGRDTPIPSRNISTLHALAFSALGAPERIADSPKMLAVWNEWIDAEGFPYFRLAAPSPDVDEAAAEAVWSGETLGDQCFGAYQVARAKLRPVESLTEYTQEFVKLWERFKGENDALDFTDLLDYAWRDTAMAPGDPAVIMGDETQDLSRLGLRLLRKWAERAEWLVTVGDPLQCLYAWAGTDPDAFITPDIDDEHKRILSQSYRVPQAVHDYALAWIEPLKAEIESRFGKPIEYMPRRSVVGRHEDGSLELGAPVAGELRRLSSAHYRYPETAVNDAEGYLEQGKSVMFLASCSHMLDPLLAVLRQRGLPFHNPWRKKRGDWNPLGGRRGVSAKDRVLSFLRLSESAWGDSARTWNAAELWHWLEVVEAKGLVERGGKTTVEAAAKAEFGANQELDVDQLVQWLQVDPLVAALEASQSGELEWLEDRLLETRRKAMTFPLTVARVRGAAKLRERPQVIVGTIHSLKGSEADVVYVFPDLSQSGMLEWCRPGPGRDGVLRAFYVALTRARESLVLCSQASPTAVGWN